MAEIRQELVLEDKFSRVLDDFMKRLQQIEEQQKKLIDSSDKQNKQAQQMHTTFDNLNNTLLRVANNGLVQLQNRLLKVGAAFLGFRALYSSFMNSARDFDTGIRFTNRAGNSGDLNAESRQLALKYGGSVNDYNQITSSMATYSNTNQTTRMQDLGAKLASITPNMSIAQGMSAVNSAMRSRSGTGLINQFGLNADRSQRREIDILLQQGRLDEALDIVERLSEKAGATEKSLNRMMDSPMMKLQQFQAKWEDLRKTIGDGLLQALMPVIDALDRLFNSAAFEFFIRLVKAGFELLGQTVADVVNFMVDNFDKFKEKLTTIGPKVALILAHVALFKVLLMVLPPLFTAVKAAITATTAAQWLWNAAMTANPIGLVAAGITALIAGLVVLTGYLDKGASPFERFTGILFAGMQTIKNVFSTVYNAVGQPVVAMINIFGSLMNVFANMDKPLVALRVLFINIFTSIATSVISQITKVIEFIGTFVDAESKIGKMISGAVNTGKGALDWISENKAANDAWAKENGFVEKFKTDVKLPEIAMGNVHDAYDSGKEAWNTMADKFNNLGKKVDENTKATRENTGSMDSLGGIIDKDTWMDKFNFATSDITSKTIQDINNNYTGGTYSVVVNGVGDAKTTASEIEKVLKDFKLQESQNMKNAAAGSGNPGE